MNVLSSTDFCEYMMRNNNVAGEARKKASACQLFNQQELANDDKALLCWLNSKKKLFFKIISIEDKLGVQNV